MKLDLQRKLFLALVLSSVSLTNCGKSANSSDTTSSIDDSSTSGVAAGAVGGALSNSGANGTQARMSYALPKTLLASIQDAVSPLPQASAANMFCPTFRSSGGGCTASGSNMWLNYNDCTFTGRAEWNGTQELSMSSGTANCGFFPSPGANGTLYRQFVTAPNASTPGQVTVTAVGRTGTIDDASPNLANFNGDSIASTNPDGGYGSSVAFNASDERSSLIIAHHLTISGVLDHSVTGSLSITEGAGASSRTLNGAVKVYHNLLKVIGTSTFTDVIHEDICCLPVGGVISTTFTAGTVSPTKDGQNYVGKTETLTFTGCGTATVQGVDGAVSNVTLNRCF